MYRPIKVAVRSNKDQEFRRKVTNFQTEYYEN